jgi:hypothetical protein
MIIFDLDNTLADCEHRRHFVDREKAAEKGICYEQVEITMGGVQNGPWVLTKDCDRLWKPDWNAFHEACDKDKIIWPVKSMFIANCHRDINIWSGRCELVRKKTINWIHEHTELSDIFLDSILKMRPIGDTTPDEQLKEKWLDYLGEDTKWGWRHPIEYVFDSHRPSIEMWRRRGIFVFDCNQRGGEF